MARVAPMASRAPMASVSSADGTAPMASMASSPPRVSLRPVEDTDLEAFFAHGQDPEAIRMAAFVSRDPGDRPSFDAHWARIRAHDGIILRTIVADGAVAGHVSFFVRDGEPELGYWIDRARWGRGIASAALGLFLPLVPIRPVYARVVADNHASRRVLGKWGFVFDRVERAYAEGRGAEVEEHVMRLD